MSADNSILLCMVRNADRKREREREKKGSRVYSPLNIIFHAYIARVEAIDLNVGLDLSCCN